nr:MAG TPA: hypothetical protein [Caudoviricetes sp.]
MYTLIIIIMIISYYFNRNYSNSKNLYSGIQL